MINRREMLSISAGVLGSLIHSPMGIASENENEPIKGVKYAAFIKFVQSLSYEQLAEKIAEMGYQGIEATIRKKGYIEPEKVEQELPLLVSALEKHRLKVLLLTTDVCDINDKINLRVLQVATKLGIKQYRMGYYNYNLKSGSSPFIKQLAEFKPMVRDLAAFNRETGIQGLYQNHAGAKMVGSTVWDIRELLEGINASDIAVAFDIRHAMATSGESWPILLNIMQEHLGCIYVKDCKWENGKLENKPLGTGMVNKRFFELLKQVNYNSTMSLHVEYLEKSSVEENLAALKTDLQTLQKLMS